MISASIIRSSALRGVLVLLALVLLQGDTPVPSTVVLAPFPGDSVAWDTGKLFLVSVSRDAGENLLVSTQWEANSQIELSSKALKEEFPKTFIRLVPPGATLQSVSFIHRYFRGFSAPVELGYSYADTASIASLWVNPAFVEMVRRLQGSDVLSVIVSLRGWKDTTLAPVYDDPSADNRVLYKHPVRLVPGRNEVRFAPAGDKRRSIAWTASYVHESTAPADRAARFHASGLEASCAACHEGLPSAASGASMTADCATCHKEHRLAEYLHGPVEMNECSSCHAWSADKGAVEVTGGVPGACGTCHGEKVEAAETAAHPHAVAGECATCHSPHSSDRPHLLKDDVNALCQGCHEGFDLNHPVGRHPVRFRTVASTGKELSCASCHDPHGGAHPKLLTAPNTSAEICAQCH